MFETHPVAMYGLLGHPQLEVVPEFIMAVCWWGVGGDGTYMLFIFASTSTHALSKVLWVTVTGVFILFCSTDVLVSFCLVEFFLDPIPSQSAFLFFSALIFAQFAKMLLYHCSLLSLFLSRQ